MTNQLIEQPNFDNRVTTEIPPSQRVYAFKDLPPDVQAKLLQMQNTDGDFLRLNISDTPTRVFYLIFFVSFPFACFLATFEFSQFDLGIILFIAGGTLIFMLWYFYLIWGIFKTIVSPIKSREYVTPTQVIKTMDGTACYRELKDAAEISVNRYWDDTGRRSSLDIKFDDGDNYQYRLGGMRGSVQFSETKKWQEQAAAWRDAAIRASKRGDAEYFDSRDVFQKSLTTNPLVLKKDPRKILLKIMLALFFAEVLVCFLFK